MGPQLADVLLEVPIMTPEQADRLRDLLADRQRQCWRLSTRCTGPEQYLSGLHA
jgi:hypothetical protein